MRMLPRSDDSLLVRTDFTSDEAWQEVSLAARAQYEDDFQAYVEPVSDPAFEGAPWQEVRASVPANDNGAAVLFIADTTTLAAPDHPILVVDLQRDSARPPFRCIPPELWGIDNNLNIANMNWDDFADAVDEEGTFRGFHQ
jgi:hypothetical protein